jgi:hypothetical protein
MSSGLGVLPREERGESEERGEGYLQHPNSEGGVGDLEAGELRREDAVSEV